MTAVVGILNKHAAAIAADSAVTFDVGNGRKTLNCANKIFMLSKYHPVGVMLYNAADFMGTPWEIIIKLFRKELGTTHFNTLEEYQSHFIAFLRSKKFFSTSEEQQEYLYLTFFTIIYSTIQAITVPNQDDNQHSKLAELITNDVAKRVSIIESNKECDEFHGFTQEQFDSLTAPIFQRIIEYWEDQNLIFSVSQQESLKKLLYVSFRYQTNLPHYTGVVFIGYGETDIFPKLIAIKVGIALAERLYFFIDETASIKNNGLGIISPFAQTDVMETILLGAAPELERTLFLFFEKGIRESYALMAEALSKFSSEMASIPTAMEQIKDAVINKLIQKIADDYRSYQHETYISPLLKAVNSFSKEDLAEMAESLIYTTYLKRRMTFAEESVGGPVDVAVISKGDGFIWIKRKHYFKPEINKHFFDNYYRGQ